MVEPPIGGHLTVLKDDYDHQVMGDGNEELVDVATGCRTSLKSYLDVSWGSFLDGSDARHRSSPRTPFPLNDHGISMALQ